MKDNIAQRWFVTWRFSDNCSFSNVRDISIVGSTLYERYIYEKRTIISLEIRLFIENILNA